MKLSKPQLDVLRECRSWDGTLYAERIAASGEVHPTFLIAAVDRTLNSLERRCLIKRASDGYELTQLGADVLGNLDSV